MPEWWKSDIPSYQEPQDEKQKILLKEIAERIDKIHREMAEEINHQLFGKGKSREDVWKEINKLCDSLPK